MSLACMYTRRDGLEMRFTLVSIGTALSLYAIPSASDLRTFLPRLVVLVRYPSRTKSSAIAHLNSEKGTVTVSWPTRLAFFIRMSISLNGSVIIVLPRGLFYAGDITLVCLFAKTNTAEIKITHKATLATTTATAPYNAATP